MKFQSIIIPRLGEWITTGIILNMAFMFRTHPNALFIYGRMDNIADADTWATLLFTLAGLRAAILIVNGAWMRSPHLRAIASALACFAWAQFMTGTDVFSQAVAPVLFVADIINIIRATRDARFADDYLRGVRGGQK